MGLVEAADALHSQGQGIQGKRVEGIEGGLDLGLWHPEGGPVCLPVQAGRPVLQGGVPTSAHVRQDAVDRLSRAERGAENNLDALLHRVRNGHIVQRDPAQQSAAGLSSSKQFQHGHLFFKKNTPGWPGALVITK